MAKPATEVSHAPGGSPSPAPCRANEFGCGTGLLADAVMFTFTIETNPGLRRPTLNQDARFMAHKNERVELEMKIMKYRALARQAGDDVTRARIKELVAELERKLREIDE